MRVVGRSAIGAAFGLGLPLPLTLVVVGVAHAAEGLRLERDRTPDKPDCLIDLVTGGARTIVCEPFEERARCGQETNRAKEV